MKTPPLHDPRSLRDRSSPDQLRALFRFMAAREFVASREELLAFGFSQSRIKNWVRNGRLITIVRSVYSYGSDVQTPEAVRRAALLAAGPGSALARRTACEAWDLVRSRSGLSGEIEVGSPTGQNREYRGLSPALGNTTIKVKRCDFRPGDIRMLNGLQVVRPVWALVDLAADAVNREVRFAFLEACRLNLCNQRDIEYCFTRFARRRGVAKLKPYFELWIPELARTRSVWEGWFLIVWVGRGYPVPKVNEKVFGHEVDIFLPEFRFALELDSDAFHGDPVQKKLDAKKQRHLESQGLAVERLSYKTFERDPVGEVDRIARLAGCTVTNGGPLRRLPLPVLSRQNFVSKGLCHSTGGQRPGGIAVYPGGLH